MSEPEEIARLIANLKPRVEVPRGFGFWHEGMIIAWLKQNQKKSKKSKMQDNDPIDCKCRNCGARYNANKSRADWKGYCGQSCFHDKARRHGYKKSGEKFGRTEYRVLSDAGQIGSIPWS